METNPLHSVDFICSDGKPCSGLVPVHSTSNINLSVDERAVVYDVKSYERIDYIFFRRFNDGRSSQIAAFVVDNSDEMLDEKNLAKLHLKVWINGSAPLLYVAWPSRIDILTCAKGPDFWRPQKEEYQYSPAKSFEAEALKIAGEIKDELKKYSAFRLADGTFWEELSNRHMVNHAKAAHQSLIQATVEADREIGGEKNPNLRHLLLLMVLIKYLEDRRVFPNHWFNNFRKGANGFVDVLTGCEPEQVYRLLDALEQKFNGDIFILPKNGKNKLTKKNLETFAFFVEGKTLNRQRFLWEQYSFEHLPVEIISHIYQRFVKGGHGTIYTPPFLAGLLLDHTMPYNKLAGNEKVLDPACGSGVFLVGAFRRLVNVWRSQNDWKKPDVKKLKQILKRSIFGVELDPLAVNLTAFSLSLAICDALKPDVIWKNLKFDPLCNSNLFEADFFQLLLEAKRSNSTFLTNNFDIVIGNPPFESKLTLAGKEVNEMARKQNKSRGLLPDKQTAYLFFEQAMNVLKLKGRICLIQPSGLLYNRKVNSLRTNIFSKYKLETIFDFTSVRKLYEADPKTIAVLAKADFPQGDFWINHWTFRRTASVKERICFELDHYDRHRVSQKQAETDSYIWRSNLLGGGRLFGISENLRSFGTLGEYVKQEMWDYGEGFNVGSGKNLVPFLTGKKTLPTKALSETGIDEEKIATLTIERFDSPGNEKLFTSPIILIKELESLPMAYWNKGFLSYRHRIVGIHAPQDQHLKLRKLFNDLQNNLTVYQFCNALHSTESMVDKATTIRKQDIDVLPYPKDLKDLTFSFWEKALCEDILTYITEYVRLGQNSKLLISKTNTNDLKEYASMFIRMLGSVYDNLQAANPIFLNGLICQPFFFGERPNLDWIKEQEEEEFLKFIYEEENHECLRTIRILRFYSDNLILIVKPEILRYWIRSTAIRDADDTLIDLRKQGY